MTKRAKCVLFPGTVSLLIASLGEMVLWRTHTVTPWVYQYWSWLNPSMPMLGILLAAGAAGSACSLLSGGNLRQRVWAAEFPAFCTVVLLLAVFIWACLLDSFSIHAMDWRFLRGALGPMLGFGVAIPAVALLLGALPFAARKAEQL